MEIPGYVILSIRLFLGSLLFLSATTKIGGGRFAAVVAEYGVLPERLASTYARIIPWLELITSLWLISGLATPIAGLSAAILFGTFSCAIALNLWRNREIDCHCFGTLYSETLSVGSLVRVLVLLTASLTLVGTARLSNSVGNGVTAEQVTISIFIAAIGLEAYFVSGALGQLSSSFRFVRPTSYDDPKR